MKLTPNSYKMLTFTLSRIIDFIVRTLSVKRTLGKIVTDMGRSEDFGIFVDLGRSADLGRSEDSGRSADLGRSED